MYFRYDLSTEKENNTLMTLVDALIMSTHFSDGKLKNFLLSCLDRMKNLETVSYCLQIMHQYSQELTSDLLGMIHDQSRNEEAQRINKILHALDDLTRTINQKLASPPLWVNNPPMYFEITHEEFVLYESYKDLSSSFQAFFSEFKAQGQHNSRSRQNRIGSKLKYEYILPEELETDSDSDSDYDKVEIELVEDETPTFLPQFEQLTLQTQASSASSVTYSSPEPKSLETSRNPCSPN